MAILNYLYNSLLLVFYSVTMALAYNYAYKEKKESQGQFFFVLGLYLLFFIFDNVIVSLTEVFTSFAHIYNKESMGMPLVKTLIYTVNNFCQLWLLRRLAGKTIHPSQWLILIFITSWIVVIPLFSSSALAVYLYYLPNQLLLLYLAGLAWYQKKKLKKAQSLVSKYLTWIGFICLIFGLLILLEDSFVIFRVDSYHSLNVKIQNRNFSQDIFNLCVCLLAIRYFLLDYPKKKLRNEKTNSLLARKEEAFFSHYRLTQRECEICQLLLEHKNNQEIADTLFLSIGTVKAHIHNIYLKMAIHQRDEIYVLFDNFKSTSHSL